MATATAIETPSGKGASDENFPVGSWLLPKKLRPHIARYYRFARAIDDIADNPELSPETKVERLNAMADAVCGAEIMHQPGFETAKRMHESLVETNITSTHCTDLVDAFRQDAVKGRYTDWDELIGYCMRSAAPVGRYLLDLHGEDTRDYEYSDALCNALQVINHLQDCKDDYHELNRVYLPSQWLSGCGIDVTELDKSHASAALRTVIDRCLESTRGLMEAADELPKRLKSRQLAMESAVIVNLAHKLVDELSRRDPLAERVVLTKPQLAVCTLSGILRESFRLRG
ncbi:MAG: squalene synthase HpnC [Alphaproteobacteria bacterium]|nr:squalene synthase HpnC [Alphaproteobacteria bacterium]